MAKEIDLGLSAQNLIFRHKERTKHLSPLLRGTAEAHYARGVEDCLQLVQQAAVAQAQPSAPLAVQPAHAAQEEP